MAPKELKVTNFFTDSGAPAAQIFDISDCSTALHVKTLIGKSKRLGLPDRGVIHLLPDGSDAFDFISDDMPAEEMHPAVLVT